MAEYPDLNNLDHSQQLALLRGLTKRTGAIHEAQVMQLRLWPFAVDPQLDRAEADVDVEGKQVLYRWENSDAPRNFAPDKKYAERLTKLEDSIKFMFGASWKVTVALNGNSIFPLKKIARVKPPTKRKPAPKRRATPAKKAGKRTRRK